LTVEEFISDAFQAATGKIPTFAVGSTKWNNLLAAGNRYQRVWARTPGIDWNSLYDPAYSAGTVTAAQTFDLDDEIRKISQQESDVIRITHSGSTTVWSDYTIVDANRLRNMDTGNYAARIGRTIRFNNAFNSSSPQFGGTIYLPVYLFPEVLTGATDDLTVDDPDWLVYVVAADYVRNDVTRQDLRADLIAEANDRMERMREDNDSQSITILSPWNPLGHTIDDSMAGYV
jgi:hypothetical protein